MIFLNTGTTDETFQQSGKQDSFRHILMSAASTYESSGTQFFRTTTGIQSGPDAFDESRFVVNFLTTFEVMEILCSFRLILQGKTGKEISEPSRLEFLEKVFANNFTLSDAEDNTLVPRFTFVENTISNLPKVPRVEFLGVMNSFVLVAYASLAASRTLLQWLLACLNFILGRFILLVQTRKLS